MAKRDYDLLGADGKRAVETGLASAAWYHSEIPRKEMKALMQRSNHPAIRDTVLYYGLILAFAACGIALWPSLWSLPFWLAYAVLFTSGADSRWHECGHNTAFRTRWMNQVVYQIACFALLRNPVLWRWSHVRHHTDTIIVGRDPEIVSMRPPDVIKLITLFFGREGIEGLFRMVRHALSGLNEAEKSFVPEAAQGKVARVARIWLAIYAAAGVLALASQSLLPFMLIGGPMVLGSWHYVMTGILQHTGLAENVLDHRLNTRTVYMNPISRFIYWNMNYHVEHHMFPMVPYHRLPELHARIKNDLPVPNRSILAAYAEVWSSVRRQLGNEDYFLKRHLPPGARPYREDFHAAALGVTTAAE